MSAIETLIRLHKWHVEQAQQHLGELLTQQREILQRMQELEEEVLKEKNIAWSHKTSEETLLNPYAAYIPFINTQRQLLFESNEALEPQIEDARNALTAAYREEKKYAEIANRQLLEKRAARQKKVQKELDEITSQRFGKSA